MYLFIKNHCKLSCRVKLLMLYYCKQQNIPQKGHTHCTNLLNVVKFANFFFRILKLRVTNTRPMIGRRCLSHATSQYVLYAVSLSPCSRVSRDHRILVTVLRYWTVRSEGANHSGERIKRSLITRLHRECIFSLSSVPVSHRPIIARLYLSPQIWANKP